MTHFAIISGPVTIVDCAAAILAAAALSALAVSLLAVRRMRAELRAFELEALSGHAPCPLILEIHKSIEEQKVQLRELQERPVAIAAPVQTPAVPRAGLNLHKRSQVLRMHRKGETVEQIAAALELPRQEVDLVVKVHRIVLQNV